MNKTVNYVFPYVYKLVHKQTGEYYFGYRSANKVPAHLDLGIKYFTSSKTINEIGFENFDIFILAEFFDKLDAYNFESKLIEDHISDPINLNGSLNGNLYPSRKFTTIEHRKNLSKALKGKSQSKETIAKIQLARQKTIAKMSKEERKENWSKGGKAAQLTISKMSVEERKCKFGTMTDRTHSPKSKLAISVKLKGKKHSEETKQNMSLARKGRKTAPETIEKLIKAMSGSKNPRAISVTIDGVVYQCKKDARIALGWSKNKLSAYFKNAN